MAEILSTRPTAEDLVESAMLLVGVIGRGQSATTQELDDGLAVLNAILDHWNQRRELIYEVSRNEFVLTASKNPHTIGLAVSGTPGTQDGDIGTARPQMIEEAAVIPSGAAFELPVKILTGKEYRDLPNKGLSSSYPTDLWYEREWPLGKIWLWPTPSEAAKLIYYVWQQLPSGLALADLVNVPPGYLRALRYNLAIEIAPEYGKMLDETGEVRMIAQSSMAHLAALNLDKRMVDSSGES